MQNFPILRLKCLTALDSSGENSRHGGKCGNCAGGDGVVYSSQLGNCYIFFPFLHSKRICWICFLYVATRVFVSFSGENGKKYGEKK